MVHWERTVRTLCVVAVAVEVLVAFALMVFVRPMADDFVRQYDGITRGWWGVISHNYLHWCGRWTSMGLEAIAMPRVMDSAGVRRVFGHTVCRSTGRFLCVRPFAARRHGAPGRPYRHGALPVGDPLGRNAPTGRDDLLVDRLY